jgi:PAS domain S-box-containing protein
VNRKQVSTTAIIISPSLDFRIITWNRGAENLLGFTEDEAIGRQPLDLFAQPAGQVTALFSEDVAALRASRASSRSFEQTSQRKDGSVVDASFVVSGIYDSGAQLTGLSAILCDVTERKRAGCEQGFLAGIVAK